MSIFRSLDIGSSALTAERLRMDIISSNIANVNTTKTEQGGPYRRQMPVFQAVFENEWKKIQAAKNGGEFNGKGVRVTEIIEDNAPFRQAYEPDHPHADEKGYVYYPNVNIVREMVDMISASRAYEANVTTVSTAKTLFNSALQISQ